MVARFEFSTAARIIFGPGTVRDVPAIVQSTGRKLLLVTGRTPDRAQALCQSVEAAGVPVRIFPVPGEPSIGIVEQGAELARREGCDVVLGFGGGSAIDAAKAIAILATNPGDIFDHIEVVGRAQPFAAPALPTIAVPTTAGTGAEVTRNAVLSVPEQRVKASLRSATMLPRVALVDPELTHGLPPAMTASTGVDALTQLIEPFVSPRATPMTDALVREALPRAAKALPNAHRNGSDGGARTDMACASLFSGLCLANAGLGAVHGFAAPIGGSFAAPHGAVCAALLGAVMRMNIAALAREGSLHRFDEVARLLTGNSRAKAADGVEFVRELCAELATPRLRDFGVTAADLPEIARKAAESSSMKGNPTRFSQAQLVEILSSAL